MKNENERRKERRKERKKIFTIKIYA